MKQITSGAVSQLKHVWKTLFILYLPIGLLFFGAAVLSRTIENVSLGFLLRDISVTGNLPFFAGFVSQLTGLLWAAALTICLFALILARRTADSTRSRRFLLHSSILTGALLLDDVFLVHDEIFPIYLHLPEELAYGAYAMIGIGFVVLNWKEILSGEYAILLLALGLFAVSIFLDSLPLDDLNLRYFWEQLEFLLEDGFKFAGVATWLTFFVRYTLLQFQPAKNPV